MISTGTIYTLHEHLCLTILNRGRRLLPDDQLALKTMTDMNHPVFFRLHTRQICNNNNNNNNNKTVFENLKMPRKLRGRESKKSGVANSETKDLDNPAAKKSRGRCCCCTKAR